MNFISHQEASSDEEHCIQVAFFHSGSIPIPEFGGSEIIINLSGHPLSLSEFPVAQPAFHERGEFLPHFDIVIPPLPPSHNLSSTDLLTEQYNAMKSKRHIKVWN